jgi:Ser/Thr protein kinase RdoA (MazF antagonist)
VCSSDLHASVRSLNYTPRFSLDHFHDTPYHASKLIDSLPQLTEAGRELGHGILRSYVTLPTDIEMSRQLIHGDPKLDNMLFRDGKPFTLIDFDTIMKDSVWTDVGDFLRSLTGKLLDKDAAEAGITNFVAAYREASNLGLSPDQTAHQALRHTGRIALELGMRYLCDIVDGNKYFSWSAEQYDSRHDNHIERAALQLRVAQFVIERL